MLFNSINFIIFFPIVVCAYWILPDKIKQYWLLAASYYFYMCWNPKYILLLMASTLITFLSGIAMEHIKKSHKAEAEKSRGKKLVLLISLILNLGLLFYFKYINFALDSLSSILGAVGISLSVPAFDIVLPVGISFYIFQALGYSIDVYRDDIYAEKNIFRYALFVSFFPQLVAGPIERSKNLLQQLAKPGKFCYKDAREGLITMLWGYFIKIVIADRVALLVDTIYGAPSDYSGMEILLAVAGFSIQIYCDFMGYSIIAKGSAKVLGYNIMSNFEMPYLATSIRDFWRRWHISLSTWFKDYLYIPLGGNRKGPARKWLNLMITFLISGLWHGANVTFILWGGLHGAFQVIEDAFRLAFGTIADRIKNPLLGFGWKVINILKTMVLSSIAWVIFRASDMSQVTSIFTGLQGLNNWHKVLFEGGIYSLGIDETGLIIIIISLIILLVSSLMREHGINLISWISGRNFVIRYAVYWSLMLLIICSLDITGQEFIYFQF